MLAVFVTSTCVFKPINVPLIHMFGLFWQSSCLMEEGKVRIKFYELWSLQFLQYKYVILQQFYQKKLNIQNFFKAAKENMVLNVKKNKLYFSSINKTFDSIALCGGLHTFEDRDVLWRLTDLQAVGVSQLHLVVAVPAQQLVHGVLSKTLQHTHTQDSCWGPRWRCVHKKKTHTLTKRWSSSVGDKVTRQLLSLKADTIILVWDQIQYKCYWSKLHDISKPGWGQTRIKSTCHKRTSKNTLCCVRWDSGKNLDFTTSTSDSPVTPHVFS